MSVLDNWTPDLICTRLSAVDQDILVDAGTAGLLVDLDNTLCPWHGQHIDHDTQEWIAEAKKKFSICLVSNTTKPGRLQSVADRLEVPSVARWGLGRKPFAGGIMDGLDKIDVPPQQAAIIGDQLLADVWGGNRLGLFTVWVKPIDRGEFIGTKPARIIEALLLPRFRKLGILPQEWDDQ